MADDDDAVAVEAALDGDASAPIGDPAQAMDLQRQRRVHLLLTAYLTSAAPEQVYASIRASTSGSRRERIAEAIGERVGRPMRHPGWRWPALWPTGLIAAAAVVLACGLWFGRPAAPAQPETSTAIRLATAPSGVLVQRAGRLVAAVPELELETGDTIESPTDGAEIVYADGSRFRLAAGTRLLLQGDTGGRRLRLAAGLVTASVAPQPPGKPLVIAGRHGQAEVVGTAFTFAEDEIGTRLHVDHGLVRLSASGAALLVAAGTQALAVRDRPPEVASALTSNAWAVRMTDVCDLADAWGLKTGRDTELTLVHDRPATGTACLRLDIRRGDDQPNWGTRGRLLTLRADDRALRFQLRVERAEPGAEIVVQVHEADHGVQVLAQWPVAASAGWRTVVVPIPPPERRILTSEPHRVAWQPERVQSVFIGARFAALTVCVDQFDVLEGR